MIADSNIIIYAALPQHAHIRKWVKATTPAVSAVSVVEVLGFHKITDADRRTFEELFEVTPVLPVSDDVIARAVLLRQSRKMKLGDAIIAATALVHGRTLATRNTADFTGIDGLTLLNPMEPA